MEQVYCWSCLAGFLNRNAKFPVKTDIFISFPIYIKYKKPKRTKSNGNSTATTPRKHVSLLGKNIVINVLTKM